MEQPLAARLAGVGVVVYDTPVNTLNRPAALVGRDSLIEEVSAVLDTGRRVLLHGLGGNGKTALAATVADRRVEAGKGSYAWVRMGQANEEAFFEAVLTQFASDEERERIRADSGDRKVLAIKSVLAKSNFGTLVVDDLWSGPALFAVLNATPDAMPVLVTSRTRFTTSPGGAGLDVAVEVGNLAPEDALRLLANHAGEERCRPLSEAEALCKDLGYHAFAVEIAGRHLRHYSIQPGELRVDIRGAPHDLPLPGGLAEEGRESVKRLLDHSYQTLAEPEARVFQAFGAMTSPGATVDLLATYLSTDAAPTKHALSRLTDLSLVKRSGETRFYTVHDLTFSYARALASGQGAMRTIRAVRQFVDSHTSEHDLLELDIENILGGAAMARGDDPGALVGILGDLAAGGYIDNRGHGSGVLSLLDDAIDAARRGDSALSDVLHQLLSKRGNAHVDLGEPDSAIRAYREALDLAPSQGRRAILLAVIGKVLAAAGQPDEAHDAFAEAFAEAEASQDRKAMLGVMVQDSVAAFDQKDFQRVLQIASRGLDMSRQYQEPASEATFLNNLGSAEFEIGVRASLGRHEEARAIAARIRDNELLALAQWALGIDHHALEEFEEARTHLGEALRLYGELDHTKNESNVKALMRKFGYSD